MTCQEFLDGLLAWLDLELESATVRAHDLHVTSCGGCQAYVRQYMITVTAVQELADEDTFEEIPEPLVRRILDGRRVH